MRRIKKKQKPVEPPSQNELVESNGGNESVEDIHNSVYQRRNILKELSLIKGRVNQVCINT